MKGVLKKRSHTTKESEETQEMFLIKQRKETIHNSRAMKTLEEDF
jgi:hypothetical protein